MTPDELTTVTTSGRSQTFVRGRQRADCEVPVITRTLCFARFHRSCGNRSSRGVVLQSARGPSPSLAELVAGAPIRGSWWGHPRNHEIFDAINRARSSSAIVATPLVRGKVTLVHRRLWPPLVRLADRFDVGALDALHEEHSASGAHRVTRTAFPGWVPSDVMVSAQALSEEEALTQLPEWLRDVVVRISRPK